MFKLDLKALVHSILVKFRLFLENSLGISGFCGYFKYDVYNFIFDFEIKYIYYDPNRKLILRYRNRNKE